MSGARAMESGHDKWILSREWRRPEVRPPSTNFLEDAHKVVATTCATAAGERPSQ